jgi:hypothetical protein
MCRDCDPSKMIFDPELAEAETLRMGIANTESLRYAKTVTGALDGAWYGSVGVCICPRCKQRSLMVTPTLPLVDVRCFDACYGNRAPVDLLISQRLAETGFVEQGTRN